MRLHIAAALVCAASTAHAVPTLTGFASLPADSFVADSPVSGNFITPANGRTVPFANNPVQGISAILRNPDGTYKVLQDNGYGAKGNSQDAILYNHDVSVDFRRASGGTGTVTVLRSNPFSDPNAQAGFTTVSQQANYPIYNAATNSSTPSTIPVASAIRSNNWLTGSDFDLEGMVRAADGTYYVGDEFGPFLLHFDQNFRLIGRPIALPGVFAPENPFRGATPANLGSSRGFEGVAIAPDGRTIYTLLEGTVAGDPARTLRINIYDATTGQFSATSYLYQLDAQGTNIGDFTWVGPNRFVVLERDNGQGATAQFKRAFLIDLSQADPVTRIVQKTQIIDLLNIADPFDLNQDGATRFTFPFQTIEDVIPVGARTLLIGNDNNYPFSNGRTPGQPDNNEFILVQIDDPLFAAAVPQPAAIALFGLGAAALLGRRTRGTR
jgi:hypothetical protein